MPLQSPSNPSGSFLWLKKFNAAILGIISRNHTGFSCAPYLKYGGTIGKLDATGIHTSGRYWTGFYYRIWNNQNHNAIALPWFGFGITPEDEVTINITIHPIAKRAEGISNIALQRYLLSIYRESPYVTDHPPVPAKEMLLCQFRDYMKMGYGSRAADPAFSLSNWIYSIKTQESDLEDFFETINADLIVPHI